MAGRVCPVWIGYFLSCPIRKLFQHPEKILSPYIKEGMKVLDVGCAMGFFSLPLARMVGSDGKVICVDVQEGMIKSLEGRARKEGLFNRIETRICKNDSLGLSDLIEEIDFIIASAVVHEVPDISSFFSQLHGTLKSTGHLLVIEPKGHVSEEDFNETIAISLENGFEMAGSPEISRSRAILLKKKISPK
jgi:ubiquinone/menaquinone biosynthesis C-methylase UbiE